MTSNKVILVGVEDRATASAMGTAAAHIAMDERAAALLLVHVLDDHTIANAVFSLGSVVVPLAESTEEGDEILGLAEAAFEAECAAKRQVPPRVTRALRSGPAGRALAEAASEASASAIVVGARRSHVLGRLTHPDVREYVAHHTAIPVRVVMLQEDTDVPPPALRPVLD
jgi:nucleotide-binding universal stress UspA family protein